MTKTKAIIITIGVTASRITKAIIITINIIQYLNLTKAIILTMGLRPCFTINIIIFEYNKMTDSLITGNTTLLILYELRKINATPSETKEEQTLNFRMIKPTE